MKPRIPFIPTPSVLALIAQVWLIPACAEPIHTAGYFSALPHTLITFDVDGKGQPVVLENGTSRRMSPTEYAAQGITLSRALLWVNDAGQNFDDAQAIGGSPTVSLFAGQPRNPYLLHFTVPVRAFGFWLVHNGTETSANPAFTALDSAGQVIERVTFGDEFRQGTLGQPGSVDLAEYGFMGIAADRDIASVRVEEQYTQFDNLYFTPVPEPKVEIHVSEGAIPASQVEICFDTIIHRWFRLDYSESLNPGDWRPLTAWTAGEGTKICTGDAVQAGQSLRFYRVTWSDMPPAP